jgi:hypothetical protein
MVLNYVTDQVARRRYRPSKAVAEFLINEEREARYRPHIVGTRITVTSYALLHIFKLRMFKLDDMTPS